VASGGGPPGRPKTTRVITEPLLRNVFFERDTTMRHALELLNAAISMSERDEFPNPILRK
jgi:hypothetical protein